MVLHGIFNLTFRVLQHTSSKVTVKKYTILDHFEILANGRCYFKCKIKETMLIRDLKPVLSENFGGEKLLPALLIHAGCGFFCSLLST